MSGQVRVAVAAGVATLAAAFSLHSVFSGLGWVLPVVGAVAIVVAVNQLVRSSPLPVAAGPVLAAALLLCYLTALYAGDYGYAHVLPTGAALTHLQDVARQGFHDIRKLGTPVPTHDGLVLIATVAVAGVALVVDLFAVAMRRAAIAGLPMLAVFVVCTSVAKHGAGWLAFVIGTAGYLWLLLADSRDRLARWGRPVGTDRTHQPRFTWSDLDVMPSPLSVLGRRIGLSAIAVAVVVPLAIPGVRGGVPHGHGGNGFGSGSGSAEAVTVNPIVAVGAQLTSARTVPLLSVLTNDPDPGYLRLTSLDRFDGQRFFPSTLQAPESASVSNGLPVEPVSGSSHTTQVSVQNLAVHWLPLPTQPTTVTVDGDWRYDVRSNTVFSARTDTRGLDYSATSVSPDPAPRLLEASPPVTEPADPEVALALARPDVAEAVTQLTRQVVAGAASPFDKAVAIQQFLTGGAFTYDLTVPQSDSASALADFLLHTRRGFCQQFAGAMTVMARLSGIPARIAVGFTPGERQPDGTWLITTKDAHAWPELYFSGFGWLPFEPTPRRDGQTVTPTYSVPRPDATGNGGGTDGRNGGSKNGGAAGGTTQQPSKNQRLDALLPDQLPPAARVAPASHDHRALIGWTALGVLLLLLAVPAVLRAFTRRRRWRGARTAADEAAAAWAELRANVVDARAGWVDGLSPRATARVLRMENGGLTPVELRALDRIVEAVQRAWYSAGSTGRGLDDLRDDVELIRAALLSEATFAERAVLRLWPRSALQELRGAGGRVAELLDAVDLAGARLRARMRPRHAG